MVLYKSAILLSVMAMVSCTPAASEDPSVITFHGLSDASAAITVGDMFVVADDEMNILRVYRTAQPFAAVSTCDLASFLGIDPDHPEADIEGATLVGDRIYWITSHGRNKEGKMRPNRYRFFATDIKTDKGRITITPAGRPCTALLPYMLGESGLVRLGLHQASQLYESDLSKKEREELAPKEQGLNIEGLASPPDGGTLYIAFRNPRPVDPVTGRRCALVVPLTNPVDVVEDSEPARFGKAFLWDFGGLGIRSMEYSSFHKAFFIVAGPHDEGSGFVLYRWSGNRDDSPAPVMPITARGFTPEALAPAVSSPRLLILSDDGSVVVTIDDPSECMPGELIKKDKCLNKHLVDTAKRTFRAMFVTPASTSH